MYPADREQVEMGMGYIVMGLCALLLLLLAMGLASLGQSALTQLLG